MVAEDYKVQSGSTPNVSDTNLTDEEKLELEKKRTNQQTATRNKLLTDSISGNKTDLEEEYQRIKQEKSSLLSAFNKLHQKVEVDLHPDYTHTLQVRAKNGYEKLGMLNVWNGSKKIYRTFQTAYTNLRTTGSLGGVNIGTSTTDTNQLTNYVSNKLPIYGKQSQVDSENYTVSVQKFQESNNDVRIADRTLSDAIDSERGLVDGMKIKDNQLRNISIAQGYLA